MISRHFGVKQLGFSALAISLIVFATDVLPAGQPRGQSGHIDCRSSSDFNSILAFEDFCAGHARTRLRCGQKVSVLERVGPWLSIVAGDGSQHFVASTSVLDSGGKAFGDQVPVGPSPDCSSVWSSIPGKQGLYPLFTPDPGYTDQARKAHVQGVVLVSAIVGTDGIVRDAVVQKGLGMGLDEKALEAVRQWRFRPELEDGKPVSKAVRVEVAFRLLR
jgi:TonB family protein